MRQRSEHLVENVVVPLGRRATNHTTLVKEIAVDFRAVEGAISHLHLNELTLRTHHNEQTAKTILTYIFSCSGAHHSLMVEYYEKVSKFAIGYQDRQVFEHYGERNAPQCHPELPIAPPSGYSVPPIIQALKRPN